MSVTPATTTTSTTTTVTTTDSQELNDMKTELQALKELLSTGDQQNAETIKKEMQAIELALESMTAETRSLRELVAAQARRIDELTVVSKSAADAAAKAIADAKNEIDVNLDALREEVSGVMDFFATTPGLATGVPARCNSNTACVPEVSSDGDGTLTLEALSGKVQFESNECGKTDLCELSRQVQGILEKFEAEDGP